MQSYQASGENLYYFDPGRKLDSIRGNGIAVSNQEGLSGFSVTNSTPKAFASNVVVHAFRASAVATTNPELAGLFSCVHHEAALKEI